VIYADRTWFRTDFNTWLVVSEHACYWLEADIGIIFADEDASQFGVYHVFMLQGTKNHTGLASCTFFW
jgi:hypothetical protein